MAKKQPTPKRKTAKRRPIFTIDHETMKAYITKCLREMDPLPEFRKPKPKPSPKAKPKAVADEPRVTGPHPKRGWDIRTKTHWYGPVSGKFIPWEAGATTKDVGMYYTKDAARRALPAARKAWAEIKNSSTHPNARKGAKK